MKISDLFLKIDEAWTKTKYQTIPWYERAKIADKKVSEVYKELDAIEKQVGIIRNSMDRQKRYPGKKDTIAGVEDSASNAMMMIEFAKSVLNNIVEISGYNSVSD